MPVSQGTASYSIGRDCSVVLMGPYGRVDLPNVTGFDAKQNTTAVKSMRLDGNRLAAEIPAGWSGTFSLDRGDNGLDATFAQIEDDWMNNGVLGSSTIYQYITEIDGSLSTYQFTQAALKFSEPGHWQGDQIVKQTVSFEANQRIEM